MQLRWLIYEDKFGVKTWILQTHDDDDADITKVGNKDGWCNILQVEASYKDYEQS